MNRLTRSALPVWSLVLALTQLAGWSTGSPVHAEPPPEFVLQWGTTGSAEGEFGFTWGLATGPLDHVYVVEAANHRVQKFDSLGNFLRMWGWGVATGAPQFEICTVNCQPGISGDGTGQLNQARGVSVSAFGQVFVADEQNHRIHKFDLDGSFLESWGWGTATGASQFEICTANCQSGIPGPGDGQFSFPHAVAVDPVGGSLFVVDSVNNRLQKFTSDGTFLAMWGWGINGVWLNNPSGAAVDSNGNVYVVEPGEHRVQKLDAAGHPVASWAAAGSGPGEFDEPHGVAVDSFDNFYVAERFNHRVQKFDADGSFLTTWGSVGGGGGQFVICTEIALDSVDSIYVADHSDRIQKFEPSAETLTNSLLEVVQGLGLSAGTEQSLVSSLDAALAILGDGVAANDSAAIASLEAFINKVEAQRGKKLSDQEADALVAWAETAISKIGG